MEKQGSLGIIGLGVMGRNLAQNFARQGYLPIGYDVSPHLPADFHLPAVASLEELTARLTPPRVILLMVPAGNPVDQVITALKLYLQAGDVIIDGGNSYFVDTQRRFDDLESSGIAFIGMGVSGGESGALWGPSLMPGGSAAAWAQVQPMAEAIAAKAEDGEPCVAWMGSGGAGHYVKMVHNGIEYADMQLIAEAYDLLHRGAGLSNRELASIFEDWNTRKLRSYLIEITAKILAYRDADTGRDLVDCILDEAAQKGTGKWASQTAFDTGAPIPTINAAVESRLLSALKEERLQAAPLLGQAAQYTGDPHALVPVVEHALYASKIMAYAQGLSLLKMASREYNWGIELSHIVPIWRAGCIIRAELLNDITRAFRRTPFLANLLLDPDFAALLLGLQADWRTAVQTGIQLGIPMLASAASLAYFDAYRSAVLPANLIQAQRDYFGAHTYRRVDKQGVYHTDWEG